VTDHPHHRGRLGGGLAALMAGKATSNVALRWVGPFLPTLERAFGTSTGTLASIIGTAELSGLSTWAAGGILDRGHHRRVIVGGLCLVSLSSVIALSGSIATFAITMVLLVTGVTNLTIAGLALIGDRVPYDQRGRAIGLYETSWALSLLIGAPALAVIIDRYGWRGAYISLAALTALGAVVVAKYAPAPDNHTRSTERGAGRLPGDAWPPLFASACIAAAGLGIFVVSGAWMADRHGLEIGGLGAVATAMGAVELVSSSTMAAVSDRIGIRRSVLIGVVVLLGGLGVMAVSASSTAVAIIGLCVFLGGFEYGFVSSLSMMSEAAPLARGRALAIGNAISTVARSVAVVISGQLYDNVGMGASITLAALAATAGLALTTISVDRRHAA